MNRCPCCGQVIIAAAGPFDDQPVKRRIYDFLRNHPEGVNRSEIADHIYADDPDGGPDTMNVIAVHIHKMRKRLVPLGLTITGHQGPGSLYRLRAASPPLDNRISKLT
jgi:DNA-binding response OmpR family regulator